MAGEVESLTEQAMVCGSVERWQDCFPCPRWCSASCFNLNEAWEAVVRAMDERDRLHAWKTNYKPGCYVALGDGTA